MNPYPRSSEERLKRLYERKEELRINFFRSSGAGLFVLIATQYLYPYFPITQPEDFAELIKWVIGISIGIRSLLLSDDMKIIGGEISELEDELQHIQVDRNIDQGP